MLLPARLVSKWWNMCLVRRDWWDVRMGETFGMAERKMHHFKGKPETPPSIPLSRGCWWRHRVSS